MLPVGSDAVSAAESAERPDPVERARVEHERFIAVLGLSVCAVGVVVVAWRMATVEAHVGAWILLVPLVFGAGYVQSFFDRNRALVWKVWARGFLEVSATSVIMLLDRLAGNEYLVTSSTHYVYMLVVFLGCLRLRPRLCASMTGLAIVEQVAIYIPAIRELGETMPAARLYQELFFRLSILLVCGVVGAMIAHNLKKEIRGAAEEERVRTAFGSYVDQRVVARVLAGDLNVRPERREITVMFVDIRGFTPMAEKTDPARVFSMLDDALGAFSLEVQRNGGIVNKFLGDGLMAIFGAPEAQHDHVRRAVRAGLQIVSAARARAADGRFPGLVIGVGIHTGEAVVGDLGGARREYTAIGDVVNVASRVEAANKDLGTSILVTDAVRQEVAGIDVRSMRDVELRGREGHVVLYEVLALEGTVEQPRSPRAASR